MEYSPPPLFKQGPSALARLIFFVVFSLVLLVSDARYKTLEVVRAVLDAGLYPLQRVALLPRDLALGAAEFAVTNNTLRRENQALAAQNLQLSLRANQVTTLTAENTHLRALLDLSRNATTASIPAQVQYGMRDPFTQKVVIGRGSQQGVQNGSPVVSEDGMIGQVTRVFPMQSEVTLLTDKDEAVPVEIVRTGLRSVVYGTAVGDTLELHFVPISADVVAGDELVTSGLDGVYPQGLPVAKVVRVDKQADTAFARVVCAPIAAVRGARDVLVLHYRNDAPPRPEEPVSASSKDAKGKNTNAAEKAPNKHEGKSADTDTKAAESAGDKAAGKTPEKTERESGDKRPEGKKATEKAARKTADNPVGKAAGAAVDAKHPGARAPRAASGAAR